MVSWLGSLVQSRCGEGGALQTNVTGACGEHSWCCGHTGSASARGGRVCFPRLHCSGSRLFYREGALCGLRFQFSGSPQKHGLGWACVLCLPGPSSSGRQEPDGCTLPGCGAPHPLRGPSLGFRVRRPCALCLFWGAGSSHNTPSGCQPSRISGSLWLEAGSLFAVG